MKMYIKNINIYNEDLIPEALGLSGYMGTDVALDFGISMIDFSKYGPIEPDFNKTIEALVDAGLTLEFTE